MCRENYKSQSARYRLFKMNQIKTPSIKPYVMDSAQSFDLIPCKRVYAYPKLETGEGIAYGRHNMDCNMLYLDGHVAATRAVSPIHSVIGGTWLSGDYIYAPLEVRRVFFAVTYDE